MASKLGRRPSSAALAVLHGAIVIVTLAVLAVGKATPPAGDTVALAYAASSCGNAILEPPEQCDPPGSITCPAGSPLGAFLPCNVDCTCPPIPTTTTVTTTSSTTTTTCPEFPFLVRLKGRVGNSSRIEGGIGENDAGGVFQLGKDVFVSDGSTTAGDTVRIGARTSIYRLETNNFYQGPFSSVRDGVGPFVPPLTAPYCPIPVLTCGGPDVIVQGGTSVTLTPGTYGRVFVLAGATLTLAPAGTFNFCALKIARDANVVVTGASQSTINVFGVLIVSNGSVFGPASGTPIPEVNVGGRTVRVGQSASLTAFLSAPNALLGIGRLATVHGTFCANTLRTDKGIFLICGG